MKRSTYSFFLVSVLALPLSLSACWVGGGGGSTAPVTMTLTATASGPSQVDLAWTAHSSPVLGYDIERNGLPAYPTHITGTSFTDTLLEPGTQYCYVVSAVAPDGSVVARSNTACATTQTVDTRNVAVVGNASAAGAHSSLALDSLNGAHVSFYGSAGISYATNVSGSWVVTPIEPVWGNATSIAVDAAGAVHISYQDYNNSTGVSTLKYATNASGAWAVTAVATGAGNANSIAVDPVLHAHIAYSVLLPNPHVEYATNATGTWVSSLVSGSGSNIAQTSIALDSLGAVHIGYAVGSGLCFIDYASNTGGSWSNFAVSPSYANCGVSLALDSTGRPHVSYMNAFDLIHATNTSGAWVPSVVDHLSWIGGNDVSIDIGAGDSLHISYQDQNADLKYANNVSGTWVTRFMDAAGLVGSGNSMKVDSTGIAHISYDDVTNHTLKYTTTR